MGEQRQRTRISAKIDRLPPEIKTAVDDMLLDSAITYAAISEYLVEQGHEISPAAVGRYALRTSKATKRLLEAQEQTEALVRVVQKNPEADYTEAGIRMLMDGLIGKLAIADEEFDEMPLEKAGRLITQLSRTKAYKDKVRQDMQTKVELAFAGMEQEMMRVIKEDEQLKQEMQAILQKAKNKMIIKES